MKTQRDRRRAASWATKRLTPGAPRARTFAGDRPTYPAGEGST